MGMWACGPRGAGRATAACLLLTSRVAHAALAALGHGAARQRERALGAGAALARHPCTRRANTNTNTNTKQSTQGAGRQWSHASLLCFYCWLGVCPPPTTPLDPSWVCRGRFRGRCFEQREYARFSFAHPRPTIILPWAGDEAGLRCSCLGPRACLACAGPRGCACSRCSWPRRGRSPVRGRYGTYTRRTEQNSYVKRGRPASLTRSQTSRTP